MWLPSLINTNNITLTECSFIENNNIRIEGQPFYWNNLNEYINFINNNEFDYVLFCKHCDPPTNEKDLLEQIASVYWENDYYYLYSVR